MGRISSLVVAVLLLTGLACAAAPQKIVQFEKLEAVRCTDGATEPVNMVEGGFAKPGVFGGDKVVFWFGMTTPGAILEYNITGITPGRYRIVVGLVKSWDYGVYQLLVDAREFGGEIDLASGEDGRVIPTKVDLGIHDLKSEHILLAARFVGESPKAIDGPNPMSMAIDYIQFVQVTTGGVQSSGTFELEKLDIAETSQGSTVNVNVAEGGLANPKEFGADTVVHWFGMESPEALLRFKVPVAATGRYQVTVGVAKSWDFGIFQCMLDGLNAGPSLDLASQKEPEHTYPLSVDLGVHQLTKPNLMLGFRFKGASPNAQEGPNPASGGFDWIRLTPASGATLIAGPVGAWYDQQGVLLLVWDDGTWNMVHPRIGTTERTGKWSVASGKIELRTKLAKTTQLWNTSIPPSAATKLVSGKYDLTMVWNLREVDATMVGTLRAGRPTFGMGGIIKAFLPWNHAKNQPVQAKWTRVLVRKPGMQTPTEILPVLKKITDDTSSHGGGGGAVKSWATKYIRDGDVFGDERDE